MFNRHGIRISSERGWSRILPTIGLSVLQYLRSPAIVSLAPIPTSLQTRRAMSVQRNIEARSCTIPYYLINEDFLMKCLNLKYDFIFSTIFVWNISHSKKNSAKVLSQMYVVLRIMYPLFLSDFNRTWIFSTLFRKVLKCQISWKSVQWQPSCCMRTDGQSDRRDEPNSRSSNISNAPIRNELSFVLLTA
jgi:hypothetical protein